MSETDNRAMMERAISVASLTFGVVSVVRTLRAARQDDDGLQLSEALLRGATLAVSIALFVRGLREVTGQDELDGGTTA